MVRHNVISNIKMENFYPPQNVGIQMAINMNATTGKKTLHKMWYGDGNQIKCTNWRQSKD